jgi:RNA polymerase sigma factor (sigma-70 family)
MRFKNATLYNALRARFPPTHFRQKCADLKSAARLASVNYPILISFLNLTLSPWGADGNPNQSAEKLSKLLEIDCEILFPRYLYKAVFPKTLAAEIDGSRYITLLEARQQKLLPQSTEDLDLFDREGAHELLENVLKTLSEREQKVLRLRFGMDDGEPKGLDEISELMATSKQRVFQIQEKALHRLRHPSKTRTLKGLYPEIQ